MVNEAAGGTTQWYRKAAFPLFVASLLGAGLVFRVTPLLASHHRFLTQFPTEDGYIMLTIARNIGIGKGMSSADGTMPTNGTQPLCTFLWALGYWAVDGDKAAGAAIVLWASTIISAFAAYALFRLGRFVLKDYPRGSAIALLGAAVWFSSPLSLPHTMNCLETGANVLLVVLAVHAFLAGPWSRQASWSLLRCTGLGALLGLAFWVRNDACLLILSMCVIRVLSGIGLDRRMFLRRGAEMAVMGATSVAVASPWMIYNRTHFGSIVPVSGLAESAFHTLGSNLPGVPARLCEYTLAIFPFPSHWIGLPVITLLCTVFVVIVALWLSMELRRKAAPTMRILLHLVGLYALLLCAFYGVYFGAGYFLDRFLFPLGAFGALLWAAAAFRLWTALARRLPALLHSVGPLLLLGVVVGLNLQFYALGSRHLYSQLVMWTNSHVPSGTWIGSAQSGTLGYYHDRTINLDGKVNAEALQARLRGRMPQYVLRSGVRYLIDWVTMEPYAADPLIRSNFVVEVLDRQANLMVLRRITGAGAPSIDK